MRSQEQPRTAPRARRGSALVMVLVLTFAMAALALSAIYLSASGSTLSRLYERERDFKYAAEAALALGKSRVNRDAAFAVALPDTGYTTLVSNGTITDAQGTTVPRVRYDLYVGVTGDTIGIYGRFLTLISRAYDAGGTRHVRRLDLSMESFSKYGMFVDIFPATLCYGTGEFIRGRAHTNTTWRSCATSPGPTYFDTVSAVVAVTGTATYTYPSLTGVAAITYPTVPALAQLPVLATSGGLNLAPVSGSVAPLTSGGTNVSGNTLGAATVPRGTRIFFDTVDVNGDGIVQQEDGMMMIFDAAAGVDTSSLRADVPHTPAAGAAVLGNIVLQTQCGASFTIGGRKQFFTVNRFREAWVRIAVKGSTAPLVTDADTTSMRNGNAAAQQLILTYGTARCYPVGDPHLMLAERMIDGTCAITTSAATSPVYLWGAQALACATTQRYGGQDTTFRPTSWRCTVYQPAQPTLPAGSGQCTTAAGVAATAVNVGAWRAWTGTALPTIATTRLQTVEAPYLWPMFKPYNLNAMGIIHFTSGPIYASGTFRGNMTLYVLGTITFIDDLLYDADPAVVICRNFLGLIGSGQIMVADNAMNRPRLLPGGGTRFLAPNFHFNLNAVAMSLTGDFGVEGWNNGPSIGSGTQTTVCGPTSTSGGCLNQTGGTINKTFVNATTGGAGLGLLENRSVDPCQLTNRKPPFFPVSGRYLDNKYYEIDPNNIETSADVRHLYQKLRGRVGT